MAEAGGSSDGDGPKTRVFVKSGLVTKIEISEDIETSPHKIGSYHTDWTLKSTLELLKVYKSCRNLLASDELTKREVWSIISSKLKESNIHYSNRECSTKWRSLKQRYGLIKRQRRKPGYRLPGGRSWRYFQAVDEIMNTPIKAPHSDTVDEEEHDNDDDDDDDDDDDEEQLPLMAVRVLPGVKIQGDSSTSPIVDHRELTVTNHRTVEEDNPNKVHTAWSYEAAVHLIQAYGEHHTLLHTTKFHRKGEVWGMIADRLREMDSSYLYTGQECNDKWRSMKQRYIKKKARCLETGRNRDSWRYYHLMDDVLQSDYKPQPKRTSKTKARRSVSPPSSPDASPSARIPQSVHFRDREDEEADILNILQQQMDRVDQVVKVSSQRNSSLQEVVVQVLVNQQQFLQTQQEEQKQQQKAVLDLQQQQLSMMKMMQQQWNQLNAQLQRMYDRDNTDD